MLHKENKKKSTTKYKKKKPVRVPVLIPVIALLEVIILIAVSTYAWYYLNVTKTVNSGVITVEADSGLDIDFKDADSEDAINIWNYIDKSFAFEPATSIDGRNIYFPTSGTFDSINTTNMKFREGTINDINSKYINIDFELTNTNEYQENPANPSDNYMDVYLSSQSKFTIKDERQTLNGSALRLAFYNNDGNSGNVASTMVDKMSTTKTTLKKPTVKEGEKADVFTVYYYKPIANYIPYAYFWHDEEGTANDVPFKDWPGPSMTRISGNLYYYSFKNPYTMSGETKVYKYNKIKFSNGYNGEGNDSHDFDLNNECVYWISKGDGYDGVKIKLKTVYFLKPATWGDAGDTVKAPVCSVSDGDDHYYLSNTGMNEESMTQVTPGIYSYTVPIRDDGESDTDDERTNFPVISFMDPDSGSSGSLTVYTDDEDVSELSDEYYTLFYTTAADGTDMAVASTPYTESTIYFYNTYGWDVPHACVNAFLSSSCTYSIPMIALSGNVFYCTVPSVYLYDKVGASALASYKNNCKVFFSKTSDTTSETDRTIVDYCNSNYIYRPLSTYGTGTTYWDMYPEDYSNASIGGNSKYAVISPGVSAGFQRSANPVNAIDSSDGSVKSIIPAFATSFDDYIYGSGNPVFRVMNGQTVSMSMIIWLEGTDTHCTQENYSAKDIELYLVFVTKNSQTEPETTVKVHFYDGTQQIWTSDQIENKETGAVVNPVIQLYDHEIKRGYLMEGVSTASYGGKEHTDVWECTIPSSVLSHDIEFRRVNPYNEDEIWNRWEAGPAVNSPSEVIDKTDAYSFTAFADGSPSYSQYSDNLKVPQKSCGGLWGYFGTLDTLTVYDGRCGDSRDLNDETKKLSISYTYTYATGTSVSIEYVTAGKWRDIVHDEYQGYVGDGTYFNNFYDFVIPSNAYERVTKCQFKEYSGYQKQYAINDTRNNTLKLKRIWYTYDTSSPSANVGKIGGNYFALNEQENVEPDNTAHTNQNTTVLSDGSTSYHSYWGSDVIYVQVKNGTNGAFDDRFAQIRYSYNDNDQATEDPYFLSYLHKDDEYKFSSSDYGSYASVIPSNRVYNQYQIETTNSWNDHTNIYFTMGGQTPIHSNAPELASDNETVLFYHNTTYSTATKYNENLVSIDHYCNVFVSVGSISYSDYGGNDITPRIYWWMTDGSGRSGHAGEIYYYTNKYSQRVYKYCGIPNGAKILVYRGTDFDNPYWKTNDAYDTVFHGIEYLLTKSGDDYYVNKDGDTHNEQYSDGSSNTWIIQHAYSSTNYGTNQSVPHYVPESSASGS